VESIDMPAIDIFNDDAFSVSSLTAAIQEVPYTPGRLGQLGVFESDGITTTTIQIEKKGNTLSLVESKERGAPGVVVNADKRTMIPFNTIHLPQRAQIGADAIQNVRAFGSESDTEAVETIVNSRLSKMRRNLDATIEYHRIGAIKGQILDADGTTVLLNLYTAFGITQQTKAMALATATTKVRTKVLEVLDLIEDSLGAAMWTGVRAVCGRAFFKEFVEHDKVKEAYARWESGAALRNDPRGGFEFAGVIWEQYRGKVGSTAFVADDDAYVFPEGVPDMFITRFAPADYIETVNTNGLPYYAKQEIMPFGKGVDLEAQSNPINLCTRPGAVIKLTRT
jgi:hypothetical protein